MTDGDYPANMTAGVRRSWILLCLLLLELALLSCQHVIGREVRSGRAVLGRMSENLARRREDSLYHTALLAMIEAEEARLQQSLSCGVTDAEAALSLTRGILDAAGVAGEVREKASGAKSAVLEIELEGTCSDLVILLNSLGETNYAVRTNRLTAGALGRGLLGVTVEIEYALQAAAAGVRVYK